MKRPWLVCIVLALVAGQAEAQYAACPWDFVKSWSKQRRDSVSRALHDPSASPKIDVRASGEAGRIKAEVVGLLSACGFPLKSASDFLVTAEFGREVGMVAQFEISARVTIIPLDSGALVSFLAEETQLTGNASNPRRFVQQITGKNKGRSGSVWRAMSVIADSLRRAKF